MNDLQALMILDGIKHKINNIILGYDESLGHFTDADYRMLHQITKELYEIRRYISEESANND